MHTTNYSDTFIAVSDDCPVNRGEIPTHKPCGSTVASIQYELIAHNPYKFTSDDVLFLTFAIRNSLEANELEQARKEFFSKGQPCMRSSPLVKRYGWGVHLDAEGRMAIYGVETMKYASLISDIKINHLKGMRLKRK